jgi:hypothetical protein
LSSHKRTYVRRCSGRRCGRDFRSERKIPTDFPSVWTACVDLEKSSSKLVDSGLPLALGVLASVRDVLQEPRLDGRLDEPRHDEPEPIQGGAPLFAPDVRVECIHHCAHGARDLPDGIERREDDQPVRVAREIFSTAALIGLAGLTFLTLALLGATGERHVSEQHVAPAIEPKLTHPTFVAINAAVEKISRATRTG